MPKSYYTKERKNRNAERMKNLYRKRQAEKGLTVRTYRRRCVELTLKELREKNRQSWLRIKADPKRLAHTKAQRIEYVKKNKDKIAAQRKVLYQRKKLLREKKT
jgi:hypothetical protein